MGRLDDGKKGTDVKIAWGISWNDSKKGRMVGAMMAMLVAFSMLASPAATSSLSSDAEQMVSVIVREVAGSGNASERLVEDLGGTVGRDLSIIDGFVAEIPARELATLEQSPVVHSVTYDSKIQMLHMVNGFDGNEDMGSSYNVAGQTKARDLWNVGITGKGVDVALIDSGVAPVEGLTGPNKVVNGADLSFEQGATNLRYMDTYGHGTHLAGIIAGKDASWSSTNHDAFSGMAPDARIVNVKVANAQGSTDVSQVIAGIDWVVQHRNDNGMNIRVLNLSFGTDGVQNYTLDPLTYAAEVAWRHGIVVVVAAGNSQFGNRRLNNPAYDPFLIAVGAEDPENKMGLRDDTVPEWSAANFGRTVDLVAPGKSLVSLRSPGSHIDLTHPEGIVNSRFMRGSGTSQAAAVVSGAAALLLQHRPSLTPDQVKAVMKKGASPLTEATYLQGDGVLNVRDAAYASVPLTSTQLHVPSTGTGSLDAARGSARVTDPSGVVLSGEQDIFGKAWDPATWSAASLLGNSWSGGVWNGNSWSGNSWSGNSWSGNSWSGNSWSGNSWSGNSWSGNSWSGNSWSGNSWSGNSWSGNSWSGNSWSGNSWSGNSWSGNSWS